MNILVFDIETVPDTELGRRLLDLGELNDEAVAQALFAQRRADTGSDFLRHHHQRIIAIAGLVRTGDKLRVDSLGEIESSEAELIRRFFDLIERYTPTLVSWNGSGFDLPVLHYRALRHGITAPRYWETGERDSAFRYNNYLNRYHLRHTDLMDLLSLYQPRAVAPLDEIALLLGLPGKMGMNGGQVWQAFQSGELAKIRHYCETDVLNTYLVYLHFERMRGHLDDTGFTQEQQRLREYLISKDRHHFQEFLVAWPENK